MTKKLLLVFILAIASLLGLSNKALATHAAGGELLYSWVSDSTYKIIFKFYRDCGGAATEPPSVSVVCVNSCTGFCTTITLPKSTTVPGGNGQEVSTGCPGYPSTCNGGTFPGYREWVYEANYTLPSRCNFWRFYTGVNARNNAITNLASPGTQTLYVEATLDNNYAQGNSSPFFSVKPVPYVCVNNPYNYNNGALDVNNDSLSFSIIQPRTGNISCPYTAPTNIQFSNTSLFNLTNNPFSTANTFNINPINGQITFTPDIQQFGVITVLVKEYRNGNLIGSVMRDIQVIVKACTVPTPTLNLDTVTIAGGGWNNNRIEGCAGQPIGFCFNAKSADTNAVLVVTSNNAQSAIGSTVTLSNHFTDSVRVCFNWSPSAADTGLRVLTFTVKDSTCAPPGIPILQTFVVPFYIWPITNIQKDTSICAGETVPLKVTGGTQFTWSVIPGGSPLTTLTCSNCNAPFANPTMTTQYIATSNLQAVCNRYKDTVTINVAPLPVLNSGPDTTTCINNSLLMNINLQSLPGNTYAIKWFPSNFLNNDTIATPICTPTKDTTYIIKVTPNGQNRCAAYDTIRVKVIQGFRLNNADTAICAGQLVNISVTGDNRYTYTWTPGIGVNNVNAMAPTITPDTSRLYTIKASYPGCKDSLKTIFIDVQPNPIVFIGADRTICSGDTIQLQPLVTPGGYPNYIYSWTPPGGFNNPSIKNPVFSGLINSNPTLIVSTPAGCNGSDDASFTVIDANFLNASVSKQLCPGDTAELLIPAPVNWVQWTPNLYIDDTTSTNPKVWPTAPTYYTVIGQEASGCLDTAVLYVDVKSLATITLPDTVFLFPGDSYQFKPGGNCLYFSWFPLAGLNNPLISSPITSTQASTRYIVNAATEFGCTVTDSVDVIMADDASIDVANAFTPGSAPNDMIKVQHHGIAYLKSFVIFNRWGNKVFETNDINQGWDGRFNGQPQPMGIYIYYAEATTYKGKRFYKQGNITLIR